MKTAKEINNEHIAVLASEVDGVLGEFGFHRNPRSLEYKRVFPGITHLIRMDLAVRPYYLRPAEAHLSPSVRLQMKDVARAAVLISGGNGHVASQTNTEGVVTGYSLGWLAPVAEREMWHATGPEELIAAYAKIKAFLLRWVFPYLDKVKSPHDYLKLYEDGDVLFIQMTNLVYVAAAYRLIGDEEKARQVVIRHFSKPGRKSLVGELFKSFGLE